MKRVCILALCFTLWGCGGKKAAIKAASINASEPDNVLYNQAIKDLQRGRFNISRLTLQTLINTYPDSEYLPQAKYATAESFFKEGGSANLTQSEVEFKDYITFFPTTEHACDAQMMIAMTHVRQMQKSDRDNSQSRLAQTELSRMENYPDCPLLDEAKTKLRGVEEILADGEFKVGDQYFIKRSYPAAISRFKTILEKYPDYSGTAEVLFLLGESLRISNSEKESAIYYTNLVADHPFSDRVPVAKLRLTDLKIAIPEPNPAAIARGPQQEQNDRGFFAKAFGNIASRAPVSTETAAASVVDTTSKPSDNSEGTEGVTGVSGSSGGNRGTSTGDPTKPTLSMDPKIAPPTKKKP